MNAGNGSAIFGKRDINKNSGGQIIIDPNGERALLYSSNYYDNYKEDGLPSSYSKPSETYEKDGQTYYHQGMLIDLTTPQIRFRSGKFEVNSEGHLIAKGGGSIAGWEIGNTTLKSYNGKVELNSGAKGDNDIVFKAGSRFEVKADGTLRATNGIFSGNITSSTISGNTITGGTINGTTITGSTIRGNTITGGSLNIGSGTFKVTSDGALTASNATISGSVTATNLIAKTDGNIGGWTISSTGISRGVSSLSSNDDYGILTIPFIKIPSSSYYFELIDGGGSSVVGYFKGATDVSTTQVVGIASDNRSVVLQSNSNHIRLSAGGDDRNKNIYLTGNKLYWNGIELNPIAVFG